MTNTRVSTPLEFERPRQVIPAWLLSAVLHLAIVLLLAGWVRAPTRSDGPSELDRPVAIALARHDDASDAREYYSESSLDSQAEQPSEAEALPALASSPIPTPPELALPDASAIDVAELGPLFNDPRLSGGRAGGLPSNIDPTRMLEEEAERRRAESARGPVTTIRVFGGAAATGRSFVFLIDRSKSMGNQGLGALAAAERELINSLSQLDASHQFQVIAYHHRCVYLMQRRLLPATPENLAAIEGHLENLASFGATEHNNALHQALDLNPDVIYLLTDGGDPALSAAQLKNIARRTAGKTAIHCIQFGFGPQREEQNFLTRLAEQNGGGYGYLDMSPQR